MSGRKPFKSRWLRVNPLELVADRIKPASKQGDWMLDRQLKQANAMESLLKGNATRSHIHDLLAMHNMAVSLQKHKTGHEYLDITSRSREALIGITDRYRTLGRYVATGPELTALRELIELHNAQLEVCTVGEVQKAYEYALRVGRSGGATKLNTNHITFKESE